MNRMPTLEDYARVAGDDTIDQLHQLARHLAGRRIVHVNSTREGGGVAEILVRLVPLMRELGLEVDWEVLEGNGRFFECTKGFHNALQGQTIPLSEPLVAAYEQTNAANLERLRPALKDADFVFIHDPQPAPLLSLLPERTGRWVWRCHIDLSRPHRPVWKYLREFVQRFDASIFSLVDFVQALPHPQYLVPPSIDPLSDKNRELPGPECARRLETLGLEPGTPFVLQVSRYDRFKDPVGVIRAFRLVQRFVPNLHLVLAGGGASDDPEGEVVMQEVRRAAAGDASVHVLLLPADAHQDINALQRSALLVVQKSLKEGFGLTVTEAMWKGKPVVGGNAGGIRLQVIDGHTGYLVDTPEGAALRIHSLLHHEGLRARMGREARQFVRENFLLTRHLRDYLTLMVGLVHGDDDRIVLG